VYLASRFMLEHMLAMSCDTLQ